MVCPDCGHESAPDAAQCPRCGVVFARWGPRQAEPSQEPRASWPSWCILAGLLCLGFAGSLWYGSRPGPAPGPAAAPAPASGAEAAAPAHLTDRSFDPFVSGSPVPVLVELGSRSCAYCRMADLAIARLARESGGRYRVGTADIDLNPGLQRRFVRMGIPTFLLFREGKLVKTLPGAPGQSADDIHDAIARLMDEVFFRRG